MELRGKRVTVTGGCGFLGSAVVQQFQSAGAEVCIPRSREYNLMEAEAARRLYRDSQPEILVHLAARVGGIGANRASPGQFFYENMAMGLHVIEEARRYGRLKKLVLIGTACSYPKFTPVPFHEADLWNGYPEETNAPYGIAKKALLVMAEGYRAQYGLNSIYLIPINLYGPGDNFDLQTSHVIPALIRKFLEAKERRESSVTVWGTGAPTRGFLYVHDAAEGIALATMRYDKTAPMNLPGSQETSIQDLAQLIKELTGYEGDLRWDPTKPDGQPRRELDGTAAKREVGFEARTSLHEGLQATIEWFRSFSEAPARA